MGKNKKANDKQQPKSDKVDKKENTEDNDNIADWVVSLLGDNIKQQPYKTKF